MRLMSQLPVCTHTRSLRPDDNWRYSGRPPAALSAIRRKRIAGYLREKLSERTIAVRLGISRTAVSKQIRAMRREETKKGAL